MPGRLRPRALRAGSPGLRRRPRLGLITWDDDSPTGGNIYNAALVAALRPTGVDADLVRVGAGWPEGTRAGPSPAAGCTGGRGLSWSTASSPAMRPRRSARPSAGRRVWVLVHLPLAEEAGLPRGSCRELSRPGAAALAASYAVICPSRHTAARAGGALRPPGRGGRHRRASALPPRRRRAASAATLLCLGALTPTKNQLGLVAALDAVCGLDWTASIVGSHRGDPDYAAEVVAQRPAGSVAELGSTGTVAGTATRARSGRRPTCWSRPRASRRTASSSPRPSRTGSRPIVPAGTGAVEALGDIDGLPPGSAVAPGRAGAALREWLTSRAPGDWRRLRWQRARCR